MAMDRSTGDVRDLGTQPGHFHYSVEWMNPTYLFCTSLNTVDPQLLVSRFGQALVESHDPEAFFKAIHRAVDPEGYSGRTIAFVDCFPVRYDKGEVHTRPDDDWRIRVSFGQKPAAYSIEQEYRCAVVLEGPRAGAPDFLDLKLSDPKSFCRPFRGVGV